MTIDASTLRKWKELCDAATPGKWWQELYAADGSMDPMPRVRSMARESGRKEYWQLAVVEYDHTSPDQHIKDAAFIAASRTALPELIAEVERLKKQLEKCKEQRDVFLKSVATTNNVLDMIAPSVDKLDSEIEGIK